MIDPRKGQAIIVFKEALKRTLLKFASFQNLWKRYVFEMLNVHMSGYIVAAVICFKSVPKATCFRPLNL